ncbi:MAG: head fiber protein [Caudoviricetes sp.]|nr:MAG: head fiber protein [Caudoviricetes sp.]
MAITVNDLAACGMSPDLARVIMQAISEATPAPTPPYVLPTATVAALGGVKAAGHIANISAAPAASDFNGLLSALQGAGIMATS